ncbi:uncharacterized protein [Rutidosis leptorrhynchoides]|uniref:uncharacterized protein n=1 Tax=Rutidosis leptorrhynchoides TaxID=125765 RepID=UPI003A991DB6
MTTTYTRTCRICCSKIDCQNEESSKRFLKSQKIETHTFEKAGPIKRAKRYNPFDMCIPMPEGLNETQLQDTPIFAAVGPDSYLSTCAGCVPTRQHLWDELRQISHYNTLPWVCAGDFNEIIYRWEKVGKRPANQHRMHSFCELLNDCSLMDVASKGCAFTWVNNRDSDECVKERLDWVFCTMDWRLTFPVAEAFTLPALGSYHSLILLTIAPIPGKRKKIFTFESFWLQDQECRTIIAYSWHSFQARGMTLPQEFKAISKALASWSQSKCSWS